MSVNKRENTVLGRASHVPPGSVEGFDRPTASGPAAPVMLGSITAFFPAYNDAASLPALIAKTFDVLNREAADFEVIVVNDGSSDETGDVLDKLSKQYAPNLRIITHARNMGYGAALRSGLAASTGDWVFYTDGDGQYDPSELAVLLTVAHPDTALVNGYKLQRRDPAHRIAIGWLYNRFARALFRIRIRDIDCDFRLIRRKYLQDLDLRSTSGTICVELVRGLELSGGRITEVPVAHYPRLHGRSQFFRVRSLGVTFGQLCQLFVRLVLVPGFAGMISRTRARVVADRRAQS
jgi:glycosyltransferase involved in cell wall biosynthesis